LVVRLGLAAVAVLVRRFAGSELAADLALDRVAAGFDAFTARLVAAFFVGVRSALSSTSTLAACFLVANLVLASSCPREPR
jgi:hypothetical protein